MGGGATQAVLNDAENEGAFGVLTMAPAMQVRQSGTGAVRHVGERGMSDASGHKRNFREGCGRIERETVVCPLFIYYLFIREGIPLLQQQALRASQGVGK